MKHINYIDQVFSVEVLRDIQYATGGIHHSTKPKERALHLDAYLPRVPASPGAPTTVVSPSLRSKPALIMAFGGAFHRGSKEADEFDIDGHRNTPVSEYCHAFAQRGYAAFSIDYRLVQEDPDPGHDPLILNKETISRSRMDHVRRLLGLEPATTDMLWAGIEAACEDMRKAFEFVAASARTYGIDTQRIAVGGFSAGARMAASAIYGKRVPAAALVALSGMMGLEESRRLITKGTHLPPALLSIGENDLDYLKALVDASYAHLQEMKVASELWEIPGGTHFYPSSSPVHLRHDPSVVNRLEAVITTFLHRALNLAELNTEASE